MSKQESIDLLHALANTGVPPSSKTYYLQYTVGDEFRDLARRFEKEIVSLSMEMNGYTPRVLRGPLGAGKTHLLRSLFLRLGDSLGDNNDTLCAWVDLRELGESTDFQYLLMKGLSTFQEPHSEGYQYQKVLHTIYQRLADSVIKNMNQTKITESQKRVIIRRVLENLWEPALALTPIPIPAKILAKFILRIIQQREEKRRLERIEQRAIVDEIESLSQQSQQDDL